MVFHGFPWFSLSCLCLLSKVQHKIGPEPGSSVADHFGCLQKWAHGDLEMVAKAVALQCEAPKIAKLVYNSNNYGLWYL